MKFCCSSGSDFLYSQCRPQRSLTIDLGGMNIPIYKSVPRADCRMLTLSWERRWPELVMRCDENPEEAFTKTDQYERTALHLATFNHDGEDLPLDSVKALLRANRHAILVEDVHCYTPLHNLGFFQGGDKVMNLFCDTAIMVEQELQGRGVLPTPSRTSPLYLAAKRNAPTATLRILLQTRTRSLSQWIAPITGGESYWDPQQTLDKCSSPLEILLRGRAACFEELSLETKKQMARMTLQLLGTSKNKTIADDDRDENDGAKSALIMWKTCLLFLSEHVRTISIGNPTTTHNTNNNNNSSSSSSKGTTSKTATTIASSDAPSLLHTVACLKVPVPILLQLAVDLFPEQIAQRDDTGKFALCHVLRANHPYAAQQLIRILLWRHHTHHESVNNNNNIHPLDAIQECVTMALEMGLSWEGGLEDIVMTNSDVLLTRHDKTRLVPAALAAFYDAVPLNTIFSLLLAEPQVLAP